MAYSPPKSPSDNMNSPRERPSSVPLLGAKAKMDNIRKQLSILPNRMSVYPSKESLKMVNIPSASPKPGQYTISRPNTSLGLVPHRSLLSRENVVLTFDTGNALNRLPRISVLPKTAQTKLAPKAQAANTTAVGDTNDREMSTKLHFVDERSLKSSPSSIRSSPIRIQNAFVHESSKTSELHRVASCLSTGTIEEALSEVESEMNIAAEESALGSPRSCSSLVAEIKDLDRDQAIIRTASRISTDAIELALSEMSEEKQIEEETLHSSLSRRSPSIGVHNDVITELDKENALGRAASRLSIHAIEVAMSEVDAEMSIADMAALNTPSHASKSLTEVSNAVMQEVDSGQELERAVSQLSNEAIEMALKETEEELKPDKPSTVADEISVMPKSARSTVQMAVLPLLSKRRGIRPSVIQCQLAAAISKDMFASVISGAMIDIQKELSTQTAFACSPRTDMPLFVRNKPFAWRHVSHFKPLSLPPGNPPILNNRVLLAVTVNLCKDVVSLAMTELQAEFSLMNQATPSTHNNSSPSKAATLNALPVHLVMAPADESFDMALKENMIQNRNNIPSLKDLATKTSAMLGILDQNTKACGVDAAVLSLKALAGKIGAQHGLLTKPVNDYIHPATNAHISHRNVIDDSSNLKPSFPSLKDLAANIAAQYSLLIKPANEYQLPSAKVDAMKKKLTPTQKILLERPGWVKQKSGAKQTKIPISVDRKKSGTTKKQRLGKSAINADQEGDSETQRVSSVKTKSASNMTPGATKDTTEAHAKASKVKGKSKTAGERKLLKERRKLIKKIENGQHVSDNETVRLLKSVEPGDDQVAEMLKEIEDIETLTKEMKEARKIETDGVEVDSVDKLTPNEEMKTVVTHVAASKTKAVVGKDQLTKAASNRPKEKVGNSKGNASLHKGNNTANAVQIAQLTDVLDDQPTVNIGDHNTDGDATDISHTKRKKKKKLSVNKQPDIVPRMNKHVLRLKEENAKKTKKDDLIQAVEANKAKKKRRNMTADIRDTSADTRKILKTEKSKLPKEQRTPRSNREPLRPVRATKATEARLKHVERLKEEAMDREKQIREERLKDAEIQKARGRSRARALDPVRAKRRQEITQRKPWDPLPPKKALRPIRLPPIKQTNGVARWTHEIYDIEIGSDDVIRSKKMTSPTSKSQRHAKASKGGLLIARM